MKFLFHRSQALKEEINSWVDEKIIDEAQASQLVEKYELDGDGPWYTRSSFILSTVALLFAAMGLVLLISKNWHNFNTTVRMMMGLGPLVFAYQWGFLALRRGKSDQGELAFFFAALAFGANIFLQAQIFHIDAYFPNAFLWWALGVVPFVLYFKSKLIHGVMLFAFTIFQWSQVVYSQFDVLGLLPLALIIYMLFTKTNRTLIISSLFNILLFILNLQFGLNRVNKDVEILTLIIAAAFLLILLVSKVSTTVTFRKKIQNALLFVMFSIFFVYTFDSILYDLSDQSSPLLTLILLGLCLALFFIFDREGEGTLALALVCLVVPLQAVLITYRSLAALDEKSDTNLHWQR